MTKNKAGLSHPSLGLPQKDTTQIAKSLNQLLADQHVLYIKLRNFHWNLTGSSFVEIHQFFEKLYNALAEDIDQVAERIQQLGLPAIGSMSEFLSHATLKEAKGGKINQVDAIQELVADNDSCSRKIRSVISTFEENYDDRGTVDLLTRLILNHEKNAWMLRRYLG